MRLALALCAAATLVGTPLHAQFKKLKNLVPKAAEKAATGQAEGAMGGAGGAVPEFDDRNLEITEERLTGVLKGLAAAKVVVDRKNDEQLRKTYEKERTSYEVKKEKYDDCANDANEAFGRDLQTRLMAAQAKGDIKEMQRIADSIQKAMSGPNPGQQAKAGEAKFVTDKCGPAPVEPANPFAGDPQTIIRKEAGLTDSQWYLMRERLQILAYQKKDKLDKGLPGYSPNETQAVSKHFDQLQKLREYLFAS
ncbi:MAG TPA: hypothetical protein VFS11_04435 [Gemmatimonadales bacterium]|nr:hypothetical protein [Gemmatimonadales bacterium]